MMMKMTMKTFKIGFQNPPIFYDTLHLFSHTLILFRTVLGGLHFNFSLQEFRTIYWIKFFNSFQHFNFLLSPSITARKCFIKQSQNYFIKDDKLWRRHPANPLLVILNINR